MEFQGTSRMRLTVGQKKECSIQLSIGLRKLAPAIVFLFLACFTWFLKSASAFETSVMASYSRSNYGNNSYSTQMRYTASFGVGITPTTEIEISYMASKSYFNYDPYQTTTTKEEALSLSVVQTLVPPTWVFQPYAKLGGAQYNRQQSGTINGIPIANTSTKSPSVVAGGGARIFLSRHFSLKGEIVTYLPNFDFGQAKNNYAAQGGVGWNF